MLVPPPHPHLQKYVKSAPPEGTAIINVLVNSVNGKIYIGITVKSAYVRFVSHCAKSSRCKAIFAAIQKYGRDKFAIYVLDHVDLEFIREAERDSIRMNNSMAPNGYNLDEGGMGIDVTETERERRRERGRQQHINESPESKAKRMRKTLKTRSAPEYKAAESVLGRRRGQIRLDDPDFAKKRDDRRKEKLDMWRKIALPVPMIAQDRIVGEKYINSDGVLFVAQVCKGQAPVLRKLGMDQFERDRLRFAK